MTGNTAMAAMVLLNLWAAVGWIAKKDFAFAIMFFCYAVATACLLYKGVTT